MIRAFFLMADLRLSMSDVPTEEATVCNGEIPVFDMTGFSWRHATKAVISTLRVYMKFTQVELHIIDYVCQTGLITVFPWFTL